MYKVTASRYLILLSLLSHTSACVYAVVPRDAPMEDSLGGLEQALESDPQDDESVNRLAEELQASGQLNDEELLDEVDPDFFEQPMEAHLQGAQGLMPHKAMVSQTPSRLHSPGALDVSNPAKNIPGAISRRKITRAAEATDSPPKLYRSFKSTGADRSAHEIHTSLELWKAMGQLPTKDISGTQWVQITHILESSTVEDRKMIQRLLDASGGDSKSFYGSFYPHDDRVSAWLREGKWTKILSALGHGHRDDAAGKPQKRTASEASEDSDAENQDLVNSPLKSPCKVRAEGGALGLHKQSKYPNLLIHKGNIAAKAKPVVREGTAEPEGSPKRRKGSSD